MSLRRGKSIPDQNRLLARYNESRAEYEAVLRSLHRRIRSLLAKDEINATLKFRFKTFDSYYDKLMRAETGKGRHHHITDMIGFRIICPFIEDLETVERMLVQNFEVIEIERKGSESSFKEFAYNSIHVLVELPAGIPKKVIPHTDRSCEIQIRTILQEAWAEVEHELIYKADFSLLNEPVKRKLASLNAMLTLSDMVFQEIRDFQKEVKERGRRRRERLETKAQVIDTLSLLNTEGGPRLEIDEETENLVAMPQNEMERLLFEALDLHSKGNCQAAIRIYTRILSMKPLPPVKSVIYNHRGMAYFVLSRYRKAIDDFTRAVEADSGNFRAYNHRGLVFRIKKEFSRALDDFNESVRINPVQTDGYYSRALTYNDLGDTASALRDCEYVIRTKPDHAPALQLKRMIERKMF